MKHIFNNIAAILLIVVFTWQANSQDNRTLNTKVVDILTQFPTKSFDHSDKLMGEIVELGEVGIAQFCDKIIPPGTGDDSQARYALESLSRYSGAPSHDAAQELTEHAILSALSKATNNEVKAFFIRRLNYCGSDKSVEALGGFLTDNKLYSPACIVLTTIGTQKAGEVILNKLPSLNGDAKIQCVKALGEIRYKSAEAALIKLSVSVDAELKRQALYALANIAKPSSEKAIVDAASNANFLLDKSDAMVAYIHYAAQLAKNGSTEISNNLCLQLMQKCKNSNQLHYRSAALKILRKSKGAEAFPLLLKEFKNEDKAYRQAVLTYASEGMTSAEVIQWIKIIKKVSPEAKAQIIGVLAKREEPQVLQECILPALKDKELVVRQEGIKAIALNQKSKAIPVLLESLATANSAEELGSIKNALLEVCSQKECASLAEKLNSSSAGPKVVLLDVIGAKRATDYFNLVLGYCNSGNTDVSSSAYSALKNVAGSADLKQLSSLMNKTSNEAGISSVQKAIIAVLIKNNGQNNGQILESLNNNENKSKLIPVLPFINDSEALKIVLKLVESGSALEKEAALDALVNWENTDALPLLFKLKDIEQYHKKSFNAYLSQVVDSEFPDDQKLLLIRKLMNETLSVEDKISVLRAAGKVKTFLSFVFVSEYIDVESLSSEASSSAMKIMMPTPMNPNGLSGEYVRKTAEKVIANLSGGDSRYFKIDIQEYMDKMPSGKGYTSIFNGKDLTGWQGLVKNPIARSKMTSEELKEQQVIADVKMNENWSVEDGSIVFNGKGANLCTKKKYGDFEMLVDWRITKDGDSGLYLRGTPQVQIWDTSRVDVGAQVGSGGLYNNKINQDKPLVLADNAIGDWNTFRIKMVGEKVTVYLNGVLVVDNVTMENYWDRSMPIFPEEAIELQAHGSDLAFRNIYVREINGGDNKLCASEKAEGFTSLFNGKDLDYWIGNKTDYLAEEGMIAVRPKQGGHGNLYTSKEYSNFIFRFEFQLTPGANNGLGIHAPISSDAAYSGKELQILDNTAPVYANLKPYQYHGSVYGIIAAKRGFLKPVGEWNSQEVIVKGDDIKITLNGQVIVDGNMAEASKNGTADHKEHPGLLRHKGHIGFLGHGSELNFRNIRIKELAD